MFVKLFFFCGATPKSGLDRLTDDVYRWHTHIRTHTHTQLDTHTHTHN